LSSWGALAVLGCGRIAFESVPAGDGGGDAPVPTCVGHDEDGDGFPDACDVCPSVADPDQRDLGEIMAGNAADGVGDACDPRPTLSGDYIAFAAMHASGNDASQYDSPFGAMSWTNDALRLGSANGDSELHYALPTQMTRLELAATIVDVGGVDQWFGAWYDGEGTEAVFASGSYDSSMGDTVGNFALEQDSDTTGVSLSASYLAQAIFETGQHFDIVVETALATGTTDLMSITDTTGVHTVSLAIDIPLVLRGYLETNQIVVDFEHLVIYAAH
jgi:hypothetical protein